MMTDFEEKVTRLNKHVPRVDSKVYDWALDEATPHVAVIRNDNAAFCLKCNSKVIAEDETGYARCPRCEKRVQLVDPDKFRKMKMSYEYLFRMECGMADLKLIRTFRMEITLNLLTGYETYNVKELSRHWIAQNGMEAFMGSTLCMGRFVFPDIMRLRHSNLDLYEYFESTAHPYPGVGTRIEVRQQQDPHLYSEQDLARAE